MNSIFQRTVIFLLGTVMSAQAGGSLHSEIDRLIEASAGEHPVAGQADDAEFFRRVNLDLAGVIPTADEVRKFLADSSADKRERAIDALLDGPRYAERMTEVFHVHLMERRGDHELWLEWLKDSFAENKPWDQMAREMIRSDFRDEPNRGATFFVSKRLEKFGQNPTDYPGLTRDVGRLFLGMDLQCAECHNHLLIRDYDQVDFQGLFAAFSNIKLLREEYPAVEEGLMQAKLEYASVFTQKQRATAPRVPGLEEIPIPELPKGEEWVQAPDRKTKTPGIPRFSPLAEFAEQIPQSPYFAKNIVNRVWFLMMGRGLVEPLDQFHGKNPASHPELLDRLAAEFADHAYDFKWLLRELALSETYQRSSQLPEGVDQSPEDRFLVAIQKRITAEPLLWSTLRATGNRPEDVPLENVEAEDDDGEDFVGLKERFRDAIANEPREPEHGFSPSLKSALFMMNDEEVQKLLEANDGSLVSELAASGKDDAAIAEALFLQVFSRLPNAAERAEIVAHLESNAKRKREAIRELAWAMLTSTEFVVNH